MAAARSPPLYPARHLDDGTGLTAALVELVIASIAVGLEKAAEVGEMRARLLALTVGRVEVDGDRRIAALPVAIIAHINPQSPCLGPARARRQHR